MYKMDSLYNIFRREQERVGNYAKVSYNSDRNSIMYKNAEGLLTVFLKPNEGAEDFYFRPSDYKKSGVGFIIMNLTKNGKSAHFHDEIFNLSQEMVDLAQAYQWQRDKVGVELKEKTQRKQAYSKSPAKKNLKKSNKSKGFEYE